jgi:hypothetical protein
MRRKSFYFQKFLNFMMICIDIELVNSGLTSVNHDFQFISRPETQNNQPFAHSVTSMFENNPNRFTSPGKPKKIIQQTSFQQDIFQKLISTFLQKIYFLCTRRIQLFLLDIIHYYQEKNKNLAIKKLKESQELANTRAKQRIHQYVVEKHQQVYEQQAGNPVLIEKELKNDLLFNKFGKRLTSATGIGNTSSTLDGSSLRQQSQTLEKIKAKKESGLAEQSVADPSSSAKPPKSRKPGLPSISSRSNGNKKGTTNAHRIRNGSLSLSQDGLDNSYASNPNNSINGGGSNFFFESTATSSSYGNYNHMYSNQQSQNHQIHSFRNEISTVLSLFEDEIHVIKNELETQKLNYFYNRHGALAYTPYDEEKSNLEKDQEGSKGRPREKAVINNPNSNTSSTDQNDITNNTRPLSSLGSEKPSSSSNHKGNNKQLKQELETIQKKFQELEKSLSEQKANQEKNIVQQVTKELKDNTKQLLQTSSQTTKQELFKQFQEEFSQKEKEIQLLKEKMNTLERKKTMEELQSIHTGSFRGISNPSLKISASSSQQQISSMNQLPLEQQQQYKQLEDKLKSEYQDIVNQQNELKQQLSVLLSEKQQQSHQKQSPSVKTGNSSQSVVGNRVHSTSDDVVSVLSDPILGEAEVSNSTYRSPRIIAGSGGSSSVLSSHNSKKTPVPPPPATKGSRKVGVAGGGGGGGNNVGATNPLAKRVRIAKEGSEEGEEEPGQPGGAGRGGGGMGIGGTSEKKNSALRATQPTSPTDSRPPVTSSTNSMKQKFPVIDNLALQKKQQQKQQPDDSWETTPPLPRKESSSAPKRGFLYRMFFGRGNSDLTIDEYETNSNNNETSASLMRPGTSPTIGATTGGVMSGLLSFKGVAGESVEGMTNSFFHLLESQEEIEERERKAEQERLLEREEQERKQREFFALMANRIVNFFRNCKRHETVAKNSRLLIYRCNFYSKLLRTESKKEERIQISVNLCHEIIDYFTLPLSSSPENAPVISPFILPSDPALLPSEVLQRLHEFPLRVFQRLDYLMMKYEKSGILFPVDLLSVTSFFDRLMFAYLPYLFTNPLKTLILRRFAPMGSSSPNSYSPNSSITSFNNQFNNQFLQQPSKKEKSGKTGGKKRSNEVDEIQMNNSNNNNNPMNDWLKEYLQEISESSWLEMMKKALNLLKIIFKIELNKIFSDFSLLRQLFNFLLKAMDCVSSNPALEETEITNKTNSSSPKKNSVQENPPQDLYSIIRFQVIRRLSLEELDVLNTRFLTLVMKLLEKHYEMKGTVVATGGGGMASTVTDNERIFQSVYFIHFLDNTISRYFSFLDAELKQAENLRHSPTNSVATAPEVPPNSEKIQYLGKQRHLLLKVFLFLLSRANNEQKTVVYFPLKILEKYLFYLITYYNHSKYRHILQKICQTICWLNISCYESSGAISGLGEAQHYHHHLHQDRCELIQHQCMTGVFPNVLIKLVLLFYQEYQQKDQETRLSALPNNDLVLPVNNRPASQATGKSSNPSHPASNNNSSISLLKPSNLLNYLKVLLSIYYQNDINLGKLFVCGLFDVLMNLLENFFQLEREAAAALSVEPSLSLSPTGTDRQRNGNGNGNGLVPSPKAQRPVTSPIRGHNTTSSHEEGLLLQQELRDWLVIMLLFSLSPPVSNTSSSSPAPAAALAPLLSVVHQGQKKVFQFFQRNYQNIGSFQWIATSQATKRKEFLQKLLETTLRNLSNPRIPKEKKNYHCSSSEMELLFLFE